MADIEQKREELENALSEISEDEMNQIVGGMSEKTKKHLILAGEIAGLLTVGGVAGYVIGHDRGYDQGYKLGYGKGDIDGYFRGSRDSTEKELRDRGMDQPTIDRLLRKTN